MTTDTVMILHLHGSHEHLIVTRKGTFIDDELTTRILTCATVENLSVVVAHMTSTSSLVVDGT